MTIQEIEKEIQKISLERKVIYENVNRKEREFDKWKASEVKRAGMLVLKIQRLDQDLKILKLQNLNTQIAVPGNE